MSPASRHLFGSFLVLLLGQAGGEEPAGPQGPQGPQIERLVRQLGSERFQEREAAGKALEQIGQMALPALRRASSSDDPEVRRRARDLARAVQSRMLGPIDPALAVMLLEPAKDDRDHRSPFFVAVASLARKHGAKPEDCLLDCLDEGFAVRTGTGHVVAVLRGDSRAVPGNDTQQLLLLGRDGRLLDRLSCQISNRLTRFPVDSGIFRTDVPEKPEADGAWLVIRYIPEPGEKIAGNWNHRIRHQGKNGSFGWDQDRSENIRSVEWKKKGLCRIAIRGDRFSVLFPDEAEVGRRLAAVLARELDFWKKDGPKLMAGRRKGGGLTRDEKKVFWDRYRVTRNAVQRVESEECRKVVVELRDFCRSDPQLGDLENMAAECDRVLAALKK